MDRESERGCEKRGLNVSKGMMTIYRCVCKVVNHENCDSAEWYWFCWPVTKSSS